MSTVTHGDQSNRTRLLELDGLRGIAAMLVLLYHYTQPQIEGRALGPSSWEVSWGGLGVQLFFMISGFVILMTADRAHSVGQFAIARAARLYPAYWATCVLAVVAYLALGWPPQVSESRTVLSNLTMFQGFGGSEHLLSVFWTLHVELSFYLLIALLLWMGWISHTSHVLTGLVGVWLLAAPTLGINEFAFAASPGWLVSARMAFPLLFHHLHPMPFFLIGVVLYRISCGVAEPADVGAMTIALLDVGVHTIRHRPHLEAMILTLMILTMAAATLRGALWLRLRPLVMLGEISYSVYLVHVIVGSVTMVPMITAGWDRNLSTLIALAVTLASAAACTFGLERPAGRLLRARTQRQPISFSVS